ncbi:methyl-accepting chemotaxis protein [Virgisporangium aurantiacum]|uniref:Methyl-accepting transducer domain-containing protein n=1 Tax=Virgisporangium aurantiacum TaxID=175570 RepID=A0A8J3ZIC4_9ACTN|nr:hypothetical protein Vau01_118670 [Virgisporangium aurantiacum]
MCARLRVSRSGFYEWRDRDVSATARRRTDISRVVEFSFTESDETYGYRRVYADLVRWEVDCSLELVRSIMRELGLVPCQPRPWRHSLTEAAAESARTAQRTNEIVARLGQSSTEISSVVKLITSIAEQTNLLALNATIEAARAGESGKGFAVAATEVKDLAQETAKATDDISRRIAAIQSETDQAGAAIGEITSVTHRINDYTSTIAAAVEEQTATTTEMSRNVNDAATSAADIAATISGVAQAADSTATGATQTQTTAQDLARMAAELQTTVATYQV